MRCAFFAFFVMLDFSPACRNVCFCFLKCFFHQLLQQIYLYFRLFLSSCSKFYDIRETEMCFLMLLSLTLTADLFVRKAIFFLHVPNSTISVRQQCVFIFMFFHYSNSSFFFSSNRFICTTGYSFRPVPNSTISVRRKCVCFLCFFYYLFEQMYFCFRLFLSSCYKFYDIRETEMCGFFYAFSLQYR
jgi:hypothetical protein